MKALLSSALLWMLFAAAITACIGASLVLDGTREQFATYGGLALALVTGPILARRDPVKSWLRMRSVNWFLFLFNLAVACVVYFVVGGSKGIGAAVGLGAVSVLAAITLLRGHRTPTRA